MNNDINPLKIIFALVSIGLIIFLAIVYTFVYTKYGNTPVSELPLWVFWLLH